MSIIDTSFLCSFSLNFLNSQFYTLVCVKPAFCLNLTKPVFIEYIYKLHLFLTIFLIKLRVKQNFLFLRKWYLSIIDTSFLRSFILNFLNSQFTHSSVFGTSLLFKFDQTCSYWIYIQATLIFSNLSNKVKSETKFSIFKKMASEYYWY